MILGAALLVLVALGLFVGGIATGATALYWACVAVSAVAAVLLVVARRRLGQPVSPRATAGGDADDVEAPRIPQARPAERPPAPPPPPRHVPADDEVPLSPRADVELPERGSSASGVHPGTEDTAVSPVLHGTVDGDGAEGEDDEPGVEEVEVTDLLLVVDLHDDVVVVDEHPRYHLADCRWLAGRTPIPLPVDEARTDGFTPCAVCAPDRNLAARERARRSERDR